MGGRDATMVLLDENGIRCDGRKVDEPRRIMIKSWWIKKCRWFMLTLNLVITKF